MYICILGNAEEAVIKALVDVNNLIVYNPE